MQKKLIIILSVLLVLGSFSTSHAADDNVSTENIITLEQAKSLAYNNSRNLKKYEIDVDRAKYQLDQAENEIDNDYREYNGLYAQYSNASDEYYQSIESEDSLAAQAAQAEMDKIQKEMESQYEKIESLSDNVEDFENNYDDLKKKKENYSKQLDFLVEKLYTSILNLEGALVALNQDYSIKQNLLSIEREKFQFGGSSQAAVDQQAVAIANLNKTIIEQTNQIKTMKGQLNDMMGRGYNDEFTLTPFEVPTKIEIPEYEKLLSSATQAYDSLRQINRELDDMDDELDDEDDYYQSLILRQDIKLKEIQVEDEKSKLSETISNLIADVKSKQEDYQLSLTNYQTAQRDYQWEQKRYELGRISKLTLMESELNELNMKNKKDSAGYALFLAQRSLQLAEIGIL